MLTVEIDFRMAGLDDEIPVKKKKKTRMVPTHWPTEGSDT
jgi:hypothetical protein